MYVCFVCMYVFGCKPRAFLLHNIGAQENWLKKPFPVREIEARLYWHTSLRHNQLTLLTQLT